MAEAAKKQSEKTEEAQPETKKPQSAGKQSQATERRSSKSGAEVADDAQADRQRLLKQAGIHLLAGVSAICLWAAADTWALVTDLPLATGVTVLASLVFGAVLAHLAHEWSHFVGARLSGSISPVKEEPALLMFDFDYQNNSPQQFLATGIGGSVGNVLLVLLVLMAIPLDSPGRAMLLATTVGMGVFVAVFEWPVIGHAWRHRDPMAALAAGFGDLKAATRRAVLAGVGATLALWILLVV